MIRWITSIGMNMAFEIHGQPYDDEKFWKLCDWLNCQPIGSKHNVNQVSKDSKKLVAHIKHYIDTTRQHAEFVNVEFNDDYSMFKIQ